MNAKTFSKRPVKECKKFASVTGGEFLTSGRNVPFVLFQFEDGHEVSACWFGRMNKFRVFDPAFHHDKIKSDHGFSSACIYIDNAIIEHGSLVRATSFDDPIVDDVVPWWHVKRTDEDFAVSTDEPSGRS